ncbi:hypothetical protein CCR75_001982 [Bremia lactucae]|uniref:Uncharacterized protein n=1 Tax=Bremia lactucae TaxID=4779 RepID=A0A976NZX5_BRELC|nr:hypothetical protein CCR75_001982 [Bremia lactucae]
MVELEGTSETRSSVQRQHRNERNLRRKEQRVANDMVLPDRISFFEIGYGQTTVMKSRVICSEIDIRCFIG